MNMKKVVRISRALIKDLPLMTRNGSAVVFERQPHWENLPIEIPASFEISSKIEKKNTIWSQKLVFRTCRNILNSELYIYKVELSNNNVLIIGSPERPFPVCETSQQLTASFGNSELVSVTVTYNDMWGIAILR